MGASDPITQASKARREFNLAGKDYLDEEEAAHYSCVSYSQFREHAGAHGIRAVRFMGKKVYRKADLSRAIERAFELSAGEDPAPDSPTVMRTGFQVLAAAQAASERRRRRRGAG